MSVAPFGGLTWVGVGGSVSGPVVSLALVDEDPSAAVVTGALVEVEPVLLVESPSLGLGGAGHAVVIASTTSNSGRSSRWVLTSG